MTALKHLRLRHLIGGGAGLLAAAVMLSGSGGPSVVRLAYWPVASTSYPGPAAYVLTGVISPPSGTDPGSTLTGNSTLAGHAGQIDLSQWSFEVDHPNLVTGGGASASKVNCAPLLLHKATDPASVPLLKSLLTGPLSSVDLYGVRTDLGTDFLNVRLETVFVTETALDSQTAEETVALAYSKIKVTYRPQNPDGSFASPVVSGFDCLTQTTVGGAAATATTTTLAAAGGLVYGASLQLTATVSAPGGTPTGTVSFSEGSATLCSAVAVAGGAASCSFTPNGAGQHSYHAAFMPQSLSYAGSTADLTLTVAPAPLTVTANDASRYYGYPEPAFSVSYSGFVLGEGPSVLGGALTFTSGDAPNSPAGSTWAITPGGLTSTNYAITFVAGRLTITKAPLTIAADDKTRQFGTPNPPFTATYTGFVLGEGPSMLKGTLSLTTAAVLTSTVGDYPIVAGGVTADNYAITFRDGTLHITPYVVTVVPGAEQRGAKKALVGGQVQPATLAGQSQSGTMDFYVDGGLARAGARINAGAIAVVEVPDSKADTHTLQVVFHSTNVNFTGGTAILSFSKGDDKSVPDPNWLERTTQGKK